MFDYSITRPYPWRFAPLSIIVVSSIAFVGISYFNLAVAGMTTTSSLSTTYQNPTTPSWKDRMNIKEALGFKLGCDPTALVGGATYRTPNGAFTYTIQNFVDRNTRDVFSNMNYNGSTLSNCFIQTMGVFVDYSAYDALFQAKLNCTLAGGIEVMITAPSMVTLRTDSESSIMQRFELELVHKETRTTYLAPSISRLLAAFGIDFMNQFLTDSPTSIFGVPVDTVYSEFRIAPDMTFDYFDARWSTHGGAQSGDKLGEHFSDTSMAVFENYASVLWSAVLTDLGITTEENILIDENLFRQTIHSNITLNPGITLSWIEAPIARSVFNNVSLFNLPFQNIQPTSFNARYLCRQMVWKTPTTLVLDVLVATVSLFILFWGALNLLLTYFAVGASPHGNACTCVNCEIRAGDVMTSLVTLHDPSTSSGGTYKPVPTEG